VPPTFADVIAASGLSTQLKPPSPDGLVPEATFPGCAKPLFVAPLAFESATAGRDGSRSANADFVVDLKVAEYWKDAFD